MKVQTHNEINRTLERNVVRQMSSKGITTYYIKATLKYGIKASELKEKDSRRSTN
jgi:hypothetical protein